MRGSGRGRRGLLAGAALRCQPDSRLVRLVREGHDLAFEEIVRRYRAPLVAFAGAIVPRDHAEDVVQEALVRAHAAIGRDDGELALRPWLYTIVRNRALNALRDEPAHEHLDESFDGVPQPPDVAARREELRRLIASVRGLPEPQRAALVGRELEGRSHEEIAAALRTTPAAVRGLIYRARTALRDGLGLLIPAPLLRAVLGSGSLGTDTASAGGATAAGLAAGGGGVALKAGATLGVAVIAVGSGIAIQQRGAGPDRPQASRAAQARPGGEGDVRGPGRAEAAKSRLLARVAGDHDDPEPGSDDAGSGEGPGPSSSAGPGSGDRSPSGGPDGSHASEGGDAAGPSSDDGGRSSESGGPGGSGDDGSGSSSSGSSSSGEMESGETAEISTGGDGGEGDTGADGEVETTTATIAEGGEGPG